MNIRTATLGIALGAAALCPSVLWAQTGSDSAGGSPNDASIFNVSAFDNTVTKSQTQEKKHAFSYLVGGSLLFDASATASSSFDGYNAAGSFSGKAFAKATIPFYGQLYLAYNLQHTIFQGAAGSLSSVPVGSSLLANSYELSEFFFDFNIAKRLFVRVGNQLVAWGPSTVWTPVDFINTQKTSSLQTIDLRQGKPGIKFFLPYPSWDVTLFGDFSSSIENGVVGDLAKTTKLAGRLALTVGGFELGFSTYVGDSIQSRYGFDFSGNLLGNAVYGELALLFPYSSYEFSYAGSLGLSRSLGDLKRWTVRSEFFYNSLGTDATANYSAMLASQTFIPLYVGRVYGYGAITKQQFLASFLDLTLSGIGNFSDSSYQGKLAAAFSIPGLVPFTLSLAYNGGGAGREFTYFTGNSALTVDIQVLAQF